MARTTAPLFSLDASGTIAKTIVFSKWKGRAYVRRHAVPSNPRFPLQVAVRACFAYLTAWWKPMAEIPKARWEALGAEKKITGMNARVQRCVALFRGNQGFPLDPEDLTYAAAGCATTVVVLPYYRSVSVSWAQEGGTASQCFLLHQLGNEAAPPTVDTTIAVLDQSQNPYEVRNLPTGCQAFFAVRAMSASGALGLLSEVGNATPL